MLGAAASAGMASWACARSPRSGSQSERPGAHSGPASASASEPAAAPPAVAPDTERLKILVLGGTGFLGPHFVRAALDGGHQVTLFNRGKTNTHLFPGLEKLRGDRDGGLDALAGAIEGGRRWDAVLDTSGYVPRLVRDSATLLRPAATRYLFVSSISVYSPDEKVGLSEDDPVGRLEDPTVETVDGETYGPLKALCEEVAEEVFARGATVVRPGLIVGPGDPTDRFTYWPVRCARGGDMIAPGRPTDPTQVVDARDLSAFMLGCLARGHAGRYNVTGPVEPITMGDLVGACIAAAGSEVRPEWIDAAFLNEMDVSPWMHMPAWVPPSGDGGGILQVDIGRAVGAGLSTRALESTARDTLAWWRSLPAERRAKPRAGLSPEREAEVLGAWRART